MWFYTSNFDSIAFFFFFYIYDDLLIDIPSFDQNRFSVLLEHQNTLRTLKDEKVQAVFQANETQINLLNANVPQIIVWCSFFHAVADWVPSRHV